MTHFCFSAGFWLANTSSHLGRRLFGIVWHPVAWLKFTQNDFSTMQVTFNHRLRLPTGKVHAVPGSIWLRLMLKFPLWVLLFFKFFMMMIMIMHLPLPSHRLRPPPPPPLNMYAGLQIRQKLLCHLQNCFPYSWHTRSLCLWGLPYIITVT